jgi:hypothetical protein
MADVTDSTLHEETPEGDVQSVDNGNETPHPGGQGTGKTDGAAEGTVAGARGCMTRSRARTC